MKKPNIIIMYADDLGYGDLGCYGAEEIKTPNVDSLAEEGLLFTDAYSSSPVCTPARYSLLTGRYPSRREGVHILTGDAKSLIEEDICTLPSMLKSCGYTTGISGKWHLGLSDGEKAINWNEEIHHTPLDTGFDSCFIFPATADRVPTVYFDGRNVINLDKNDPIEVSYADENPYKELPTGRDNPELLKLKASHGHDNAIVNGVGRIGFMRGGEAAKWKDENLAEDFLSNAKGFIKENKDKPFFLYYALHQPHVPRLPSPRFKGVSPLGARGDVIEEMDWCVGEILKTLDEYNLREDTIIIFSSDNGPVLDDGYDDKAYDKTGEHRPAGVLRGGKYSRFEGGIRIPFILSWKGQVQPGISNALISQADLLQSFASMLGAEIPPSDSRNVLQALLGREKNGRDEVYAEATDGSGILRRGKWLFIAPSEDSPFWSSTHTETGASKDRQLYNLAYDISEQRNVAYRYTDIADSMEQRIKEIREIKY